MIDLTQIQALSQRIAQTFEPERIVLFGSYAYGTPTQDSDVDLLVVMPFEGHPFRKASEILNAVDPGFPVDLLVRTAAEIENRVRLGDYFLREIITKGQVLYESADARMGGKSRRRFRQRRARTASQEKPQL